MTGIDLSYVQLLQVLFEFYTICWEYVLLPASQENKQFHLISKTNFR